MAGPEYLNALPTEMTPSAWARGWARIKKGQNIMKKKVKNNFETFVK